MSFIGSNHGFQVERRIAGHPRDGHDFAERRSFPSRTNGKTRVTSAGVIKKMGDLGFYGTLVRATGQRHGLLAGSIITRRSPGQRRPPGHLQHAEFRPALSVYRYGTRSRRRRSSQAVSTEFISCFGITNPTPAPTSCMKTTPSQGDHFLLNGPNWISNASGGLCVLYVYTIRRQERGSPPSPG